MLAEANYGAAPPLEVLGHTDATLAYIPVHLDYLLFELFKNAYRATIEFARARTSPIPARTSASPAPVADCRHRDRCDRAITRYGAGRPPGARARRGDPVPQPARSGAALA